MGSTPAITSQTDRDDQLDRRAELQLLVAATDSLLLYRWVLADSAGQCYLALLRGLADEVDRQAIRQHAAGLFAALAEDDTAVTTGQGDAWQAHLVRRVLLDENPFSRAASALDLADIPAGLRRAAERDLTTIRRLLRIDGAWLREAMASVGIEPVWDDLHDLNVASNCESWSGAQDLAVAPAFERLTELTRHYRKHGAGRFAEHAAFRWVRRGSSGLGGGLMAVARPDPIGFADLIGYDEQRRVVRRNTEHFLQGLPANNLLLYGERGTGKSSTVKALLNAYADQGLRLVEVSKAALSDFPEIVNLLAGRPQRFLIFIDDLSFDENETGYAELKAILEGGIEVRPSNVVLYATSNRRHLVLERFGDRAAPSDEIHVQDTLQEKVSLADRFGVTVIFLAPDQQQYLDIVVGLARRRGLPIDDSTLQRKALQWAAWNNGRSGRTARQFVDDLTAELASARD